MAGFAATLLGTEMYIWRLLGLDPKPVTCWRAPNAELAMPSRLKVAVNAFMVHKMIDRH